MGRAFSRLALALVVLRAVGFEGGKSVAKEGSKAGSADLQLLPINRND